MQHETETFDYDIMLYDNSTLDDYNEIIHVVYIYNNKLYEYNDSHCSCDGFEGEPEEIFLRGGDLYEYLFRVYRIPHDTLMQIMMIVNEGVK